MSTIKALALSFSVVLIVIGFIKGFIPKGKLNKNIKGVIGLILIAILLTPFISTPIKSDFKIDADNVLDDTDISEDAFYDKTVEEFKKRVENEIVSNGFSYISVNIGYTTSKNTVAINKININVAKGGNYNKLKDIIYDKFLAPVAIIEH